MSVKIYNGYKLNKYMTLQDLYDFKNKLQKLVKKEAITQEEKMVANLATYLVDVYTIFGEEKLKSIYGDINFNINPFFNAWDIIQKAEYEKKREHIERLFYADVIFIPVGKKILCLFYSSNNAYTQIFCDMEIVESYYYFNNSDKPEEVTTRDWNQRRKDWEQALPYAGIPSECGFIAKLINNPPLIFDLNKENCQSYVPNFNERVNNILALVLTEKEYLDFKEEDKKRKIEERLKKEINILNWH